MSRYIYAITLALQVTINQYAFSGECATGTAPSAGCTVGLDDTTYTMTGNITPVDLNTSINKTRPVVTLGATYYIAPNQSFAAQTQYQELSYTSNSAKTAYFNYNIGF